MARPPMREFKLDFEVGLREFGTITIEARSFDEAVRTLKDMTVKELDIQAQFDYSATVIDHYPSIAEADEVIHGN